MLIKACESGLELLEIKDALPHGEFEEACEKFCRLKERQRRDYMNIAKKMPELADPKRRHAAVLDNMSIRAAISYLSASDEVQSEVDERLEQGDALNKLKDITRHGEFMSFIEANCTVKRSEVNRRMRLAKENPELVSGISNYPPGGNLNLKAHYALLGAPDEVKEEVMAICFCVNSSSKAKSLILF